MLQLRRIVLVAEVIRDRGKLTPRRIVTELERRFNITPPEGVVLIDCIALTNLGFLQGVDGKSFQFTDTDWPLRFRERHPETASGEWFGSRLPNRKEVTR